MKARAKELRAQESAAAAEQELLAKIAEMWPTVFAVTSLAPEVTERIRALVARAAG